MSLTDATLIAASTSVVQARALPAPRQPGTYDAVIKAMLALEPTPRAKMGSMIVGLRARRVTPMLKPLSVAA